MSVWDTSKPVSGSNIVNIPQIHGDNWFTFEEAFSDEHYSFSSALSGLHQSGVTTVVSAGATSAVTGISSPLSGALGWGTDLGIGYLYTGEWTQINTLPVSRILAYRNLDYTIPASANSITNAVPVPFDTETKDTLSEYNISTFTFTPTADGLYLFTAKFEISTIGGVSVVTYFSIRDSSDIELYYLGTTARFTLSTDPQPIRSNTIINLLGGYKVRMYIYHNYSSSVILEGGSTVSFLGIHRMS